MAGSTTTRAGAWMLAGSGAAWAVSSAAYQDWTEVALCGLVAVGFALVAWSLSASPARRNLLLLEGLAVAAVPSTYWLVTAAARGRFLSPWVIFGAGIAVAVGAAAWLALRGVRPAPAFRLGFATVAVGSGILLAGDPSFTPWALGYALAAAGALLLVLRPPGASGARPIGAAA